MSHLFQLCIATDTGWRYVDNVEVIVPDEIQAIEALMRVELPLPAGNDGKVKAFWKSVGVRMKAEHGVDGTWMLRKMDRSNEPRFGYHPACETARCPEHDNQIECLCACHAKPWLMHDHSCCDTCSKCGFRAKCRCEECRRSDP